MRQLARAVKEGAILTAGSALAGETASPGREDGLSKAVSYHHISAWHHASGETVVRLEWDGTAKHWLVSAYEKRTSGSKTADTAPVAKPGDTALRQPGSRQSLDDVEHSHVNPLRIKKALPLGRALQPQSTGHLLADEPRSMKAPPVSEGIPFNWTARFRDSHYRKAEASDWQTECTHEYSAGSLFLNPHAA